MLQAVCKVLRNLPEGATPPLDVAPNRRIYCGPAAAANAADSGKKYSAAVAAAAAKFRKTRGEIAVPLADAEPPP